MTSEIIFTLGAFSVRKNSYTDTTGNEFYTIYVSDRSKTSCDSKDFAEKYKSSAEKFLRSWARSRRYSALTKQKRLEKELETTSKWLLAYDDILKRL